MTPFESDLATLELHVDVRRRGIFLILLTSSKPLWNIFVGVGEAADIAVLVFRELTRRVRKNAAWPRVPDAILWEKALDFASAVVEKRRKCVENGAPDIYYDVHDAKTARLAVDIAEEMLANDPPCYCADCFTPFDPMNASIQLAKLI